jgi:hypothetical protein
MASGPQTGYNRSDIFDTSSRPARRYVMRPTFTLLVLLPVLFLAGCGSDDPGTPPVDDTPDAEATIGADGGEFGDDTVTLTVPAGALGESTDLAIYVEDTGHPFDVTYQPIYRLTGLPTAMGAPVTLRFRKGIPPVFVGIESVAVIDTTSWHSTVFIGEERESHDGGRHPSWETIAARDSAGWVIVDLPRGPLDLGEKDEPDLSVTSSLTTTSLYNPTGHFKIFFDDSEVTTERAGEILDYFDNFWQVLYDADFRFGDQDTIWPLNVYMREPARDTKAEYIIGPWGKGHFNFDPSVADVGSLIPNIVLHELFHCAQDYYDTRHPSTWTTVNPARHWLDEATAAFMESLASGNPPAYVPIGLNLDNYLSPLSGIWGHDTFSLGKYGYGMSSFIRRLATLQGLGRVHDLYEAFSYHGTAYDAVMEVVDPPLATLCAQYQRDLVTGDTTPITGLDLIWWDWSQEDSWYWETGSLEYDATVSDFGSDVREIGIHDDIPPENVGVSVSVTTGERVPDPWELAVYGRSDGVEPVLLATGTNGLVVPDWRSVHQTYEQLMVQVIKPWGNEPDYHNPSTVHVSLAVTQDMTRYETGNLSLKYHPVWNTGEEDWQTLNILSSAGGWNGTTFSAAWDSLNNGTRYFGQFTATIDPDDLSLTSWSASNTMMTDAQNQQFYQTAGSGSVPLAYTGTSYLRYNIDDAAVCDATTSITQYTISEGVTTRELLSWSCDDNSYFEFYFRDLR